MKTVELVKGIKSSALGFGCAPILGAVDAERAKLAIETALACGITHYDLARSYGYGDAEKFVGKLLKSRRSEVVITTKFGIKANWKAQLLRPVKPLVRAAMGTLKKNQLAGKVPTENTGANYANKFFDRIPLNPQEMEKSVEQSLRALQSDYIDYLFIHEPLQLIVNVDVLMDMAERLKEKGKIRAFGLAYMRNQEYLHSSYLDKFDLLQFDNSPGVDGYSDVINNRGMNSNVLFSPLRGGSSFLTPEEKLKTLSTDFPNSVILCSMFNEMHIKNNTLLF
jgi:aryl-alcohol dehydrogenase-like predicted oxidoreductase